MFGEQQNETNSRNEFGSFQIYISPKISFGEKDITMKDDRNDKMMEERKKVV